MKVKIAYREEEREAADKLAALYLKEMKLKSSVVLNRSDRHKPYYHIYIADNKKLDNSSKT